MTSVISLLALPLVSSRALSVWYRNFLYFRRSWKISLLWIFVEPILAVVAFGVGLGTLIENIEGQSYIKFFFPGLMASTTMMVSYFEATYGSYTKLSQSKIFQSIVTSPVMPSDVAMGEILWAASKGLCSAIAVGLVGVVIGLFSLPTLMAMLVVLAFQSLLFAAIGLFMSTLAINYDWFVYAQTGFIAPMALFCGTYFPLEYWPSGIQWAAWLLPLTHSVSAVRLIAFGKADYSITMNIVYLAFLSIILTNWSSLRLQRKLAS